MERKGIIENVETDLNSLEQLLQPAHIFTVMLKVPIKFFPFFLAFLQGSILTALESRKKLTVAKMLAQIS